MLFAQNGKASVNNQVSTFSWLSSAFSPKKKNLAPNAGDNQTNNNSNQINNSNSANGLNPSTPTNKNNQSLSEVKLNNRKVIFASRGNSGKTLD